MSQHTKLPWQYGIRADGSIWFAAGDARPGGGAHWQGDFPGTEADAKLFAAAPEMLEALKTVADSLQAMLSGGGEKLGLAHCIGFMRAAIAKAEGRS